MDGKDTYMNLKLKSILNLKVFEVSSSEFLKFTAFAKARSKQS
ncbi:hypothetical protein [Nonlabens dokdonensis]|uniref:Uncharacterized protein n=1 Tax=Nonlabens dokdonensis (strain DSM 17205 / KCTC 12402 / DSW-6) TaxID=592029 RepID=L7W5J1_NONDD|nr:hypothetical protein [Nonlabens dokdonensis]AGC75344.1 hypothetical protein DDD_0218 [Nonlabens dokdonensis DSW-6]